MNKKSFIFSIICSFIFLPYLSLESNAHKKIHDNNLYFLGPVHSLTFTVKKTCIANGQQIDIPHGGQLQLTKHSKPAHGKKEGKIGINVRAGRHQSWNVKNCIEKTMIHTLDDRGVSVSSNTFSDYFSFYHDKIQGINLNFAVQGTLTINGKSFDDIVLAQGRSGLANNWWFGGSNCHHQGSYNNTNAVECTASDNKTTWCFYRGGTDHTTKPDHVKIKLHACTNVN